jgi:hypothetical protein
MVLISIETFFEAEFSVKKTFLFMHFSSSEPGHPHSTSSWTRKYYPP